MTTGEDMQQFVSNSCVEHKTTNVTLCILYLYVSSVQWSRFIKVEALWLLSSDAPALSYSTKCTGCFLHIIFRPKKMHVSLCYVALSVFTTFLTRALKWVMFISSPVATSLK